MDQSVRLLLGRIQSQLGAVLKDSGRDISAPRESWALNSRSPDHQKLDESGISSEEGYIPRQVYSQLTAIVSLVRDLQTTLDLSNTGTDSCSKTLSESGGEGRGDFACEEAENERMLEWYDRPMVYSRSSAQLLPAGCTPNLEVVVLKDTRMSRRAEVVVKPPSEQGPAGDRMRTRPVLPRGKFGTINYLESFSSSSSDLSSSSEDDRDTSGSRTRGERRKKRISRRGMEQKKKKVPRARHASDSKIGGGNFLIADFVVSSTDVGGTRGGSAVEGDWGAGVVQMECEIGEEEQGPPLSPLLSSSLALSTNSPSSTKVNAVYGDLSRAFLLENASGLSSSRKTDFSHSGQAIMALARRGESMVNPKKITKPCSVPITSLPRHTVMRYFSAVSVKEPSSTSVESLGSNEDLHRGKQLTSPNTLSKEEREDSVSTSGESFSSSESDSMLGPIKTPARRGLKSRSGERGVSGGYNSVAQRTPRRLGSGGRSPVARRSFPFSKPPSTPSLPFPSPTRSMAKPAHSTTPYKLPKLKSVSPSKRRLSLTKSPSPSKNSFKSPSPSNLSPTSSKSVTPTQNPSSPSSPPLSFNFSSPSPSESPSSPPPDPLPAPSKSPVTPTTSSNTVHATPSKPSKTGGSNTTKKSSPPNTKSTPSKSRKTHSNSKSSRRKDSRSTALDQTLAVDWSTDDDFQADPSPSFVISPTASNQKVTSSLPASVKTESSCDLSPVKSTPLLATMPPSPQSSSQVLRRSHSPINDEALTTGAAVDEEEGGEEEVPVNKKRKGSPKEGPPAVKAPAHSLSGNIAESGIDEGGSGLPVAISCAGCSRPIHWKTELIHRHKRLNVLICQACWNVYNTGSFEMNEGKEIYCTLCGDGGDIISCDRASCTSSLCQSCIRRIAGEQVLQRILEDESIVWECFCCNTSPLVHYRSLCDRLCQYYARDKQREKSGVVKGKARLFGDADSDCVARGESSGVKVKEVKGEMVGRGGEGVSGESSGERRSHSGGREERRGREGEGDKGDKGSGEQPGTRGEGGGGGDRKKPNKKRREVETSESDVDSSSCDGEDSPKVDTDDVSISDSSLFEGDVSSLKRVGGASSKYSTLSTGSKSSAKPVGEKNRAVPGSPESASNREKRAKRKKKGRVTLGASAHRMVFSSDSDSDFESPVKKTSPQRRRVASSSSSASNESRKEGETREKRPKKNVLLDVLSSGSEENESPQKESVKQPPSDSRNDSDSEAPSPALSLLSDEPESPVVYATPRKLHAALSSDSDDDMMVLERRPKRGHVLGSDTSSGNGGDKRSTTTKSDSPGGEKAAKKKKLQRGKRRKRVDSSGEEFVRGEMVVRGPKLKRRRVARAIMSDSDSSDSSGGEEEEEDEEEKSTPGRKRKKIRRVMTDAKLQSSTKEAQRAERERIERLKKRRLLGKEKDELILEADPVSKKAVLQVRQSLVESIKPHQWEGIRFLYDACVEKLETFREGRTQAGGAILAHCMGLGKSLQVIALIDALLMHQDSGVSRVLILSPVNTIYNWRNEFNRWIDPIDCDYHVYMLVDTSVEARVRKLERWFTGGGIIFIGYELYRNLVMGKRLRKKKKEAFEKYLLDPGPDIIVCDEGHVMRNASSNLFTVLQRVRTRTRIVLTGTPLQNNLVEYHTMVSFVKPNLLGTLKEFKNRFANPITNGQCRDSTPMDVRVMKNRAHILHEMLSGTVQRRDYRVLARFLPPKQEFVLFIRLSPVQENLYTRYLNNKSSGCHTASDLFSTFSSLQKVWNHPWVLKLDEDRKFEREERRRLYEESEDDSLDGFIVTGSEEEEEEERGRKSKNKESKVESVGRASSSSSSPVCSVTPGPSRATLSPETNQNLPTSTTMLGSSDEDDVTFPAISLKPDPDAPPPPKPDPDAPPPPKPDPDAPPPPKRVTRSTKPPSEEGDRGNVISPTDDKPSLRSSSPLQWYDDLLTPDCEASAGVSGKIQFLLELLEETGKLKEKVLVFTQSLLTLDMIEEVLGRPENGEWTPGLDYYRLDGSTRSEMRTHQMSHFNEFDNEQLRLYLISTRAGSLGVNLVAANRVIIFDACWNPSHDLQAVFRSYRFGQTKPIFVYRLLAKGTMEEKIYDRQVTKESLAMRVVDEKQIGRHYNASDLAALFMYSPAPPAPPPDQRPTYDRPEADMVLSSILGRLQPDWISSYHEHDSLLKHVFSEELSEEERKAAWDDYRAQIAQYDNATYYSALQNQLDTATAGGASLQQAVGQSSFPSASGVKNEGGILNHALQQQQHQHQLQAAQLLTILSNTNRNVENLISLLREKVSLGAHVRRDVPIPTALAVKMALNNKKITEHYALVDQGVTRVNSTLHKCHLGQIYLEPGINKQANELRARLISNLEILKSGSKNPHQGLAAVPHQPHVGGGAGPSSTSGAVVTGRQLDQRILQHVRQMQADVHRKLGVRGGPSS